MLKNADVVIGLSYGDEGKGKVTNHLLKKNSYTHCMRFNGGHNAGHTIYQNGQKLVTHVLPTGIVQGVKSIIGPGCVVSPSLLEKEVAELAEKGVETKDKLYIDKRTNIITGQHLMEDGEDTKIGTTKRGNGPAYRDKYGRKNIRFGDFSWKDSSFQVVDVYEELHENEGEVNLLLEGAQAFGLDIDWGEYPYVTSSHCGVAGALLNGIPAHKLGNIYGVCKAYDTYVGAKKFEGEDPIFQKIREKGSEFGATTGRPRQVGFLDLDLLVKSARINGVTHLIVNKVDVLDELNVWKVKKDGETLDLQSEKHFKNYIVDLLRKKVDTIRNVAFSGSPETI
jgi:adenylosuccinate synthase